MHGVLAVAWVSGTASQVDWEKSLTHRKAAIKLLEAEPDSADKALSYSHIAFGLARMLDLEQALQQGRKALGIAERSRNHDAVARACTNLSIVLAHTGELGQAKASGSCGTPCPSHYGTPCP